MVKEYEYNLNDDWVYDKHYKQKWGEYTYDVHLNAVKTIATYIKGTPRVAYIAMVHDLIEDTDVELKDINEGARDAVAMLSRNISQKYNEKYFDYIRKIAHCKDEDVIIVKFSDAVANWTLSKENGNELVKRYERSIPILYCSIFHHPVIWDHVKELSALIKF